MVSFIMTAVNYEYCFYWYLYQVGVGRRVRKGEEGGREAAGSGCANRGFLVPCGLRVLTSKRIYASSAPHKVLCESCRVLTQQPWLVRMAHSLTLSLW